VEERVEMDCLGRRVRFASTTVSPDEPATSHVVLRVDGHDREITTGPLGTARAILHEVPLITHIDESYRMGDGTLYVGSKVEAAAGDRVLARTAAGAWEGEAYSVYAFTSGPGVDNRSVVELFGALRIVETDHGVRVRVRAGHGGAIVEEPSVTVEQPDLGLLEMSQMTWRKQRGLPRWKGTKARGGEVFRDRLPNDVEYLRLINQTAYSTVLPGDGRRFTNRELRNVVDRLEIDYIDADPVDR
jgi:hypothetical protein